MYNINLDYRFSFRNEKKRKKKRKSANFQDGRNGKAERFSRDFFLLASTGGEGSTLQYRQSGKLVCLRWRFSRLKGRAAKKKGKEKRRETQRNGKGKSCHIPDFPVYLDVTKRARANRDGGTGTAQEAGIATLRYIRARDFSRYAF